MHIQKLAVVLKQSILILLPVAWWSPLVRLSAPIQKPTHDDATSSFLQQ